MRLLLAHIIVTSAISMTIGGSVHSQVIRDGTVGPSTDIQPDVTDGNITIDERLGLRFGTNDQTLLHSFSQFSLAEGQQATFTSEGGETIRAVVSRVTGQNPSIIDGKLESNITGADFFFLNPQGVVFGPSASVYVDGNYSFSTSDRLMFSDGESLQVYSGDSLPILSSAIPESFGFKGANGVPTTMDRGNITLNGNELTNDNGSVQLDAREIHLRDGASLRTSVGDSDGSPERDIELTASSLINLSGETANGKGSSIFASTYGTSNSGSITMAAPSIVAADGADIQTANNSAPGDSGNISIVAPDSLTLSGNDVENNEMKQANVLAITGSSGDAGDIAIDAGAVNIADGATIQSKSQGRGNGGDISITVGGDINIISTHPVTESAGIIRANNDSRSLDGNSGDILLEAESINLQNSARISAGVVGGGDGGDVVIRVTDSLNLSGENGRPPPEDAIEGDKNGSRIEVQAYGGSTGNAGSISIDAGSITMRDRAIILSNAASGQGGDVAITAGALFSFDSDIVSSVLEDRAGAGNVTLDADSIVLSDSRIFARAAQGDGGDIRIEGAPRTLLLGESGFSAESESGNDGDVFVPSDNSVLGDEDKLLEDFLDVSSLLMSSCSGYVDNTELSFSSYKSAQASPEGLVPDMSLDSNILRPSVQHASDESTIEIAELHATAQIQQMRGDYSGSALTLGSAHELARASADTLAIAVTRGAIGNALIAAGKAGAARESLLDAIERAERLDDSDLRVQLYNNLGNFYVSTDALEEAQDAYRSSLSNLQSNTGEISENYLLEARIQANLARAYLLRGDATSALPMLDVGGRLVQVDKQDPASLDILIHIGKSYEVAASVAPHTSGESFRNALIFFTYAKDVAIENDDFRRLSYAYGNMGNVHRLNDRDADALALTRQALEMAERAQAPESIYRWHWQEAELLEQAGDLASAIVSYRRAVRIIDVSRQSTVERYDSSRNNFEEQVEPVYLGLIEALLTMEASANSRAESQALLKEVRETLERLKSAELENYFRDECVVTRTTQQIALDSVSPTSAIVYPLVLPNSIDILVNLPPGVDGSPSADHIHRYSIPTDFNQLSMRIDRFRQHIDVMSGSASMIADSQWLYDRLIRPYIENLKGTVVDTLVFVPSGALQLVPFAALHDGDEYVVKNFALVTTSGLALTAPSPLSARRNRVLLSGVSEAVGEFKALPAVAVELDAIESLYGGDMLFNDDFTSERFHDLVQDNDYSIIHIASHATFTGSAEDSFLRAHDQPISIAELNDILTATKYRERPLELLVLSACETARGDEQAAMGLAGVGIRAGARSALASLWDIGDESTSELMSHFYAGLKHDELSKAQALRQAQLALLEEESYDHPFFWSAFVLIDNWL